jgi:hypothetical protein
VLSLVTLQAWWSDRIAVRFSLLEWLTRMHIFPDGGKLDGLRTSSLFSKLHMRLDINDRCDNTWRKSADSHQLGVSITRENDPAVEDGESLNGTRNQGAPCIWRQPFVSYFGR